MRQIGNEQQELLQLRLDLQQIRFHGLQFGVGLARLEHQRGDIFALALWPGRCAWPGCCVGLEFLGTRLHQLALLLQRLERRAVEMERSRCEPVRGAFEIVAAMIEYLAWRISGKPLYQGFFAFLSSLRAGRQVSRAILPSRPRASAGTIHVGHAIGKIVLARGVGVRLVMRIAILLP